MSVITAIRAGRDGTRRVRMFLDGRLAFSLDGAVVAGKGLHVGQELSEEETAALAESESLSRCLTVAHRYLRYRSRSESELRDKLHQRGFSEDTVEAVLGRLKEQRLVDDLAFARMWRENRDAFSPRSRWLTGLELRRKGVPEDIVQEAVRDADDAESAYQAAFGRANRLPRDDYEVFRRRLGEFLKRRGFGYGVTEETIKRLWQELQETA
jgi:regulatory protein